MRNKIFVLLVSLSCFWGTVVGARAQTFLNWQENYRAVFSWQITQEVKNQVQSFTLLVDDEIIFEGIPNEEIVGQSYSLTIDQKTSQYQLFFERYFTESDHYWQIFGYDHDGQIVLQTVPELFEVDRREVLDNYSWRTVWEVLRGSMQLIISMIVTVGSTIFFLLFVFFLMLDLVASKGTTKILSYIGLGPKIKKVGYVYNTRTHQGVPFCMITLTGKDVYGKEVYKTSVSDVNGFYNSMTVPSGEYTLVAKKPNYFFPTKKARSVYTLERDFYKGEVIMVTEAWRMLNPLIPLDPVMIQTSNERKKKAWSAVLWQYWQSLKKSQPRFEVILFVLSLIALLVEPSWFFIVVALIYGALVIRRVVKKIRPPSLIGAVVDQNGVELADAVVEVRRADKDSNFELMSVTDRAGRFAFNLTAGDYLIRASKDGYVGESEGRAVETEQVVQVGKKETYKILKLIMIPKLSEDFFLREEETKAV